MSLPLFCIQSVDMSNIKLIFSVLDSSCGDMNWMKSFLANRTDIAFTGYDIVPAMVDMHKRYFSGHGWKFEVFLEWFRI